MSITYNKNLIPLFNLLINCISARPAPQIFSIKDKCTSRFSNFQIIGLCNSSANCWFGMIQIFTTPPEDFLSKHLQANEASPR